MYATNFRHEEGDGFEERLLDLHDEVLAAARRIRSNWWNEPEDLAQDAFLAAWRQRDRLPAAGLLPYLIKILVNSNIYGYRRQLQHHLATRTLYEITGAAAVLAPLAYDPRSDQATEEWSLRVEALRGWMPDRLVKYLLAYVDAQGAPAHTAAKLGVSPNTLRAYRAQVTSWTNEFVYRARLCRERFGHLGAIFLPVEICVCDCPDDDRRYEYLATSVPPPYRTAAAVGLPGEFLATIGTHPFPLADRFLEATRIMPLWRFTGLMNRVGCFRPKDWNQQRGVFTPLDDPWPEKSFGIDIHGLRSAEESLHDCAPWFQDRYGDMFGALHRRIAEIRDLNPDRKYLWTHGNPDDWLFDSPPRSNYSQRRFSQTKQQ